MRFHPAKALAAFADYNPACRPLLPQSGLRGGRGVRAVGVATLNANSVKKQKDIFVRTHLHTSQIVVRMYIVSAVLIDTHLVS